MMYEWKKSKALEDLLLEKVKKKNGLKLDAQIIQI